MVPLGYIVWSVTTTALIETSNLTPGAHNLTHLSALPYQGMERRPSGLHSLCNIPLHVSHVCLPNTITDRRSLWNTFLILLCTSSSSYPSLMLVSQASPVWPLSGLISGVVADEMLHSWMLDAVLERAGWTMRLNQHRKDKIYMSIKDEQ